MEDGRLQELRKLINNSLRQNRGNKSLISVFISDIDTAKLYVQYFRSKQQLAQCAVSFKHCFICKRLWSGPVGRSQKWSRSLMGAVTNKRFSLQSVSRSSNGVSQRWS